MALTTEALNTAANSITVDTIKLHSGAPGAEGTANTISGATASISLGAAVAGVRSMASQVDITVPATTVSHYSLWQGSTLRATNSFTAPEVYASPGTATITSAVLSVTN